jgi:hypothetical protein
VGKLERQHDVELGSAGPRLKIDAAAMAIDDDVAGYVKPQARPDALWLGGEERVEDA